MMMSAHGDIAIVTAHAAPQRRRTGAPRRRAPAPARLYTCAAAVGRSDSPGREVNACRRRWGERWDAARPPDAQWRSSAQGDSPAPSSAAAIAQQANDQEASKQEAI